MVFDGYHFGKTWSKGLILTQRFAIAIGLQEIEGFFVLYGILSSLRRDFWY